jgi:malate synthase
MLINSARIEVGGNVDGKINLVQKIDLTKEVSGKMDPKNVQELRDMISTGVQNAVQQASSATASTLSGASATQDNVTINQNIQSIVSKTVSNENYSSIVDETLAKNDGVIKIKGNVGKNADIEINQGIVAGIIAKNVLDAVNSAVSEDKQIASVFNNAGQTTTSTSTNPIQNVLDGVAKIFGVGADVMKTYMMVCACLCCVVCLGLLAFMLSPAGQQATTTAANAGAAYAAKH